MPSVEGVDDNVPPTGYGVRGSSYSGRGVSGESLTGPGVHGYSTREGVSGFSSSLTGIGVHGYSYYGDAGVYGESYVGFGVRGLSERSTGVDGRSYSGLGVYGESYLADGVIGNSLRGHGVTGLSDIGYGVRGHSRKDLGSGVYGDCSGEAGSGVRGSGDFGVLGEGVGTGVHGFGGYAGVSGSSDKGYGLYGRSNSNNGLLAVSETGYAAYLQGNVYITGYLQKAGGSFRIDHPLDPANKYLSHSFVESPDMKNIYDGVVALDDKGEAVIDLPDWFGALNKDFRYQLTAMGAPGPNLYIAEEISDTVTNYSNSSSSSSSNNKSRFKIAGGSSGMKVSWHVTGIRKDPWANTHRIQVEEDKPEKERGYYIYPNLYGQPEEKGISRLHFPKQKANIGGIVSATGL